MRKQVLIFAGGGLGHVSGGVGTLLRYLLAAWATEPASLPVRVIDTRGHGGPVSAAVCFAVAVAALIVGGVTGRVACAHVNMTTRGSAARKAVLCVVARLLAVPVILHLHGADFFDFFDRLPVPAQKRLRAVMLDTHSIVVMGAQWRDRLAGQLGTSPSRIAIVPNGVPAAVCATPSGGPAHILFLGRLGARKGVPELLAALSSPDLAGRDWCATIAGDGDSAPFAARIAASGLASRIALPGWLDQAQTENALARADMLVLPSHHEVMPIAILEAMARGLAIIATPVGAIPDCLEHGVSALLLAPGDEAALARTIAALLDDEGLRSRLGAQARRRFAERFDIAIPAAALQCLYRKAEAGQQAESVACAVSA